MDDRIPCTCEDCTECKPTLARHERIAETAWRKFEESGEHLALIKRLKARPA